MSDSIGSLSAVARSFLSRNLPVSRALGSSEARSQSFDEADRSDRSASSTSSPWHGIDSDGYYSPDDTSDFRGIGYLGKLIASGHTLKNRNPNEVAVDDRAPGDPFDRAFLGDPTTFERYYGEDGAAARQLLADEAALREAFTEGRAGLENKLPDDLALFAALVIAATDQEDWLDDGELARLVLENRAGLAERIEEDPELKALLTADPEEVMVERSRERVLSDLLPQLANSGDILDEEFLRDHPLFALALLRDPGLLKFVEENRDQAYAIRRDAENIEARVQAELAEEADAIVGNSPFTSYWFEEHDEWAEVVVSDYRTKHDQPLGQWMGTVEEMVTEDVIGQALARAYWVDLADAATSNVFPTSLFSDSDALSLMTVLSSDLAEALQEDSTTILESIPTQTTALHAARAYGFGLGERSYGDYRRII
ncbi:hypothetical protein KQI63_13760 [bacterium]|nr:hypothetical protein [bacterium]